MLRAIVAFTGYALIHGNPPVQAQLPAHTLDTLNVVVGSRASAVLPIAIRAVEVITADDLVHQPVRGIQDVLARALGVDLGARSPAQADIAIRGGSFEQVLVLVDGMRVSDAQTGHFDLDLAVPLEEIERIEILRGPASAQYGANALGGVVNIVTRRHDTTAINGRVEAGSFDARSATAGARMAGSRLRLGGSGEYRRADGHRPGTDYRIAAAHIAGEALIADRALRATLGFADREFGASKFYTSPESDFDEFEATRVLSVNVALEAPRTSRFALEPRASVRRHDDDFVLRRDDPAFYRNVHRTWQLGGELTARYAGDRARVAVGVESYWDQLESTNLGDRDESRRALFGEVGVGRFGSVLASAGLRADWHSAYGSFIAPSLGGAVWLSPALHVRTSVSRAFRAPTWTDRYYTDPANVGDPSLDPERGWEGELGLELRTGVVQASLSGYVRSTRSLIDWARPAGSDPSVPWRIMNIEQATFRGLELAVGGLDFLGAHWIARASAISFDAEEVGDHESKSALRPLTRQASLEMDRGIVAGVDLFLSAAHVRRAEEEGRVQIDARLSRRFSAARFFVDLTNAANADYLDASAMPAPGRAVHLGLEWHWQR